jgi:dTDP-4-amino-4,6-dideoxygalactose transaminase
MTTVSREEHIPFNRPCEVGTEQAYIAEAIARGELAAGGAFTERCCGWLENEIGCARALLVHSATAALELAALLLEIAPGDEVVMPSFTFVSTANAFVLRGGVPVFVDVRPDTLNLDETLVEDAISDRTKAVVPVHYAGVPCEMDAISAAAARHDVAVVEDAAQALGSTYRGEAAGSLSQIAALSFHETKNVTSAEGGALLVNDARLVDRAEVLRDKGTNRGRFSRGEVDKYSWVDIGSSYGLSELNAAFLWAQLEAAEALNRDRLRTWWLYHEALEPLEYEGLLRRPVVPESVTQNAHIYYVLFNSLEQRTDVLRALLRRDINAVFHYVPLHSSPAGRRYGRVHGCMPNTDAAGERLLRLPLWNGITESQAVKVVDCVAAAVQPRVRAMPI